MDNIEIKQCESSGFVVDHIVLDKIHELEAEYVPTLGKTKAIKIKAKALYEIMVKDVGILTAHTHSGQLRLGFVGVDKDKRRQGIGQQLVHTAEEIAEHRGCSSAIVWVPNVESSEALGKFFHRCGYFHAACVRGAPVGHKQTLWMKVFDRT